jgi:hypothetical protein
MNNSFNNLRPVLLIFAFVFVLLLLFKSKLEQFGFDVEVLAGADIIFFIASLFVFFMQKKALQNTNPNVFVRSIIGGMMIKMFVCIIAVLIYVLQTGNNYNKRSVFAGLFIYLFYLAAEVAAISKLNKKNV